MSWNFRVLAHKAEEGIYYQIHEVYYENDKPQLYTEYAVSVGGEDKKELEWVLDKMKESLDKPILKAYDFPNEYEPD